MFGLRLLWRFGDYRYFREIAQFMKIKVPLINQEIKIDNDIECIVHGIKRVELLQKISEQGKTQSKEQQQSIEVKEEEQKIQKASEIEQFVFEQHSQIKLKFDRAIEISKQLGLDLCLIREAKASSNPILSVSAICQHIYGEYYSIHIKRGGKGHYKTVRFSDRIDQNDIMTKYNNVKRMHEGGDRRFRLQSLTDSDKSEKILIDFAKLFGKKVEPFIKTVKLPPYFRPEDRWTCNLIFVQEVPVNADQVNKKWRRRKFQQGRQKQDRSDSEMSLFDDESPEIQKEMYHAYKELNLKMPPRFQKTADLEKAMETDKFAIYKQALKEKDQIDQDDVWDQEQERAFAQKQARFNKKYFGERTVQEIVSEMQELKRSGYESEAYKVARFRQLKAELEIIMKKSDNDL